MSDNTVHNADWQEADLQEFWSDIAPCDHVVQVYENDSVFMDSLIGFIWSGFIAGDSIIVVVTPEHRIAIEKRLRNRGFNLSFLSSRNRFLMFDTEETLSTFMIDNRPDERLFLETIMPILKQAQKNNRKVRAFGEMVTVLWAQGLEAAAIELENFWNKLQQIEDFSHFCSYPRSGFKNGEDCMAKICSTHTKRIESTPGFNNELLYKPTA